MNNIKKCDFLIIAIVVLCAIALGLIPCFFSSNTKTVTIYHGDSVVGNFDIRKNTDLRYNFDGIECQIIIKDGECYIESSSCPDMVCVNTGVISSVGDAIVCVPARMVVAISGNNGEGDFDAIAN